MEQLGYGLVGFFLAGLATIAILAGAAVSINWVVVCVAAALSALLSALFGSSFLAWFKEIWWWT